MKEIEEIDVTKLDWSKRFIDPVIRWAWNAWITVEPANSAKGIFNGWRTYPDGTREMFTVPGRVTRNLEVDIAIINKNLKRLQEDDSKKDNGVRSEKDLTEVLD